MRYVFILLCVFVAVAAGATYINLLPKNAQDSYGYWVLKEGYGPTGLDDSFLELYFLNTNDPTEDSSGEGHNMYLGAGAAKPTYYPATNSMAPYYYFDGGDSMTGLAYTLSSKAATNHGTLRCWFLTTSDAEQTGFLLKWIDRNGSSSNQLPWHLYYGAGSRTDCQDSGLLLGNVEQWRKAGAENSLDATVNLYWQSVALVKEGTNVWLYRNGSLESGQRWWSSVGIADQTAWLDDAFSAALPAVMPTVGQGHIGHLAYITAQTSILTQAELDTWHWQDKTNFGLTVYDYNNRSQFSNALAVYSMNYSSGQIISEKSYNLPFTGGAANPTFTSVNNGKNGCYYLDGGDYATLTTAYTINHSATYAMWFNTQASGALMYTRDGAGNLIALVVSTNQIGARLQYDGGSAPYYYYGAYSTGVWHHAAMVMTRGTGPSFYLDGQLVGSLSWTSPYSIANTLIELSYVSTPITGYLDEGRLYNYAFTSNEVNTLYTDTKGYFGL